MAGQIVVVSGTSAAGKTTTINTFAARSEEPYLVFGIDNLAGIITPPKFTYFGDRTREGWYTLPENPDDPDGPLRSDFGDFGWAGIHALHEMVAAASHSGANVIMDHLMWVDPPILQDCIWRFEGLPVLFVAVKPPRDVLMHRQDTRSTDIPDQLAEELGDSPQQVIAATMKKLIPWYYDVSYKNDCYDLIIDTTKHDPEEVCDLIEQRLAEGPGTAFDTLRSRFPQNSQC